MTNEKTDHLTTTSIVIVDISYASSNAA